jgi:hypothetical protein
MKIAIALLLSLSAFAADRKTPVKPKALLLSLSKPIHYEYLKCPESWHYHPKNFHFEDGLTGDGKCHWDRNDAVSADLSDEPTLKNMTKRK